MMAAVREWLVSLIYAAMVIAVAENMAPAGGLKKIVSMTGGLVLLVMLLRPLGDLELGGWNTGYDDYACQVEQRRLELEEENFHELQRLIEQQTAAYISDKAKQLGLDCRVEVRCKREDGMPYPHSVTVHGPFSEALGAWMEQELDIPAERQVFHGTEG